MVVRTGEAIGSAFSNPRSWHKGVARTLGGLIRFSPADRARLNARTAALAATGARRHRDDVARDLASYAESGRRPA